MNTIHWSGMTHPGRFRKSNQDAFLGLILYKDEAHYLGKEDVHPIQDQDFVFAVSDGMGGANAGDYASKLALQSVTKLLPPAIKDSNPQTAEQRKRILLEVFTKVHEELKFVSKSYEECKGMGATLSLCWIRPSGDATLAHIGDSRIYHIPHEETIIQLSHDHSSVGQLLRSGKINEREAKNHPRRHILDQSMGGRTRNFEPQIEEFKVSTGDHIILCSDGICDGLFNKSIENIVIRPTQNLINLSKSERIIKEALYESGRDNLTSMIINLE